MANNFAVHGHQFLAQLDQEIERLQSLRTQVASALEAGDVSKPRNQAKQKKNTTRTMSLEARQRIADAQKRRWAKQKKSAKANATASAKKAAPKKKTPSQRKPAGEAVAAE